MRFFSIFRVYKTEAKKAQKTPIFRAKYQCAGQASKLSYEKKSYKWDIQKNCKAEQKNLWSFQKNDAMNFVLHIYRKTIFF